MEITETAVIGDLEHAQRFVQSVRARGCHVALDDFGSGLASFGYLPQTVGLFPGTLRENIARFGDAADAEVIAAAKRANVHDMIMAYSSQWVNPAMRSCQRGVPATGGGAPA